MFPQPGAGMLSAAPFLLGVRRAVGASFWATVFNFVRGLTARLRVGQGNTCCQNQADNQSQRRFGFSAQHPIPRSFATKQLRICCLVFLLLRYQIIEYVKIGIQIVILVQLLQVAYGSSGKGCNRSRIFLVEIATKHRNANCQ